MMMSIFMCLLAIHVYTFSSLSPNCHQFFSILIIVLKEFFIDSDKIFIRHTFWNIFS